MADAFEPVVVFRDEDATILTQGPLALYVYQRKMEPVHIRFGRELHKRLYRAHPAGLGVVLVFRPTATLAPGANSEAQRSVMLELIREANDSVRYCACVLELTGFVAAALRASATGLTLLARPRFAMRYVATVDEGARWVVEKLGAPPAPPLPRLVSALTRAESLPFTPRP